MVKKPESMNISHNLAEMKYYLTLNVTSNGKEGKPNES